MKKQLLFLSLALMATAMLAETTTIVTTVTTPADSTISTFQLKPKGLMGGMSAQGINSAAE